MKEEPLQLINSSKERKKKKVGEEMEKQENPR
jgi:hypothetical protein